jgi:hypothetical protein
VTRTWTHDGLTIDVDADPDEIAWLDEWFAPACVTASAAPDVRVVCDDALEAGQLATATGEPVTFAFDSGLVRWPASAVPGGLRLYDPRGLVAVTVSEDRREVRVHRSRVPVAWRLRLLRIVREFAHNHSIATGGLPLHAAAIAVHGRAIAIAGPRGSGKTTTALRLLQSPGVSYLSNDRIVVRAVAAPQAIAVPSVVAIRAGTRAVLPQLAERLSGSGDFCEHAAERGRRPFTPPSALGDTWYVSPRQLCDALGCSMEGRAALAAVVFPSSDRSSAMRVRRLGPEAAARMLAESVLCRRSGSLASDVFRVSPHGGAARAQIDAMCRELSASVACFDVALPDAVSQDDGTLLSACLEGTA